MLRGDWRCRSTRKDAGACTHLASERRSSRGLLPLSFASPELDECSRHDAPLRPPLCGIFRGGQAIADPE